MAAYGGSPAELKHGAGADVKDGQPPARLQQQQQQDPQSQHPDSQPLLAANRRVRTIPELSLARSLQLGVIRILREEKEGVRTIIVIAHNNEEWLLIPPDEKEDDIHVLRRYIVGNYLKFRADANPKTKGSFPEIKLVKDDRPGGQNRKCLLTKKMYFTPMADCADGVQEDVLSGAIPGLPEMLIQARILGMDDINLRTTIGVVHYESFNESTNQNQLRRCVAIIGGNPLQNQISVTWQSMATFPFLYFHQNPPGTPPEQHPYNWMGQIHEGGWQLMKNVEFPTTNMIGKRYGHYREILDFCLCDDDILRAWLQLWLGNNPTDQCVIRNRKTKEERLIPVAAVLEGFLKNFHDSRIAHIRAIFKVHGARSYLMNSFGAESKDDLIALLRGVQGNDGTPLVALIPFDLARQIENTFAKFLTASQDTRILILDTRVCFDPPSWPPSRALAWKHCAKLTIGGGAAIVGIIVMVCIVQLADGDWAWGLIGLLLSWAAAILVAANIDFYREDHAPQVGFPIIRRGEGALAEATAFQELLTSLEQKDLPAHGSHAVSIMPPRSVSPSRADIVLGVAGDSKPAGAVPKDNADRESSAVSGHQPAHLRQSPLHSAAAASALRVPGQPDQGSDAGPKIPGLSP